MRNSKISFIFLLGIILSMNLIAQINNGKIVYERKTNLLKKYKDNEWKEWLKEQNNKTKIDIFELYFTDTSSAFMPQESELKEKMSWATNKNVVYKNFKTKNKIVIKEVMGEKAFIKDTLIKHNWKYTDGKRTIAGFECRKAIWKVNDSLKIYAWYASDLPVQTGPESIYGLPGTVLGLATEDGGVIYFAKSVEVLQSTEKLIPPQTKNKHFTPIEFKNRMEKEFGKSNWGKQFVQSATDIW